MTSSCVKVIPLNLPRNLIASHLWEKICLGFFLLLVLMHYFSCRPLWLDEGFVLSNIETLSYRQIFGPLLHGQGFPRVYLSLIKMVSHPFHNHVLALRFLPLLAMMAGFQLWVRIFRRAFADDGLYGLSVLTLTCSYPFSYYAAELKPYSFDVLTAGIFTWYLLAQGRRGTEALSFWDYAAAAGLLPLLFFSYAALFFCGLVVWQLFILQVRDKKVLPLFIFYATLLAVTFLAVNHIDLRFSRGEKGLSSYWESYFLCTASASCFLETFWEGTRRVATGFFGRDKFFMQWASFVIPFFIYSIARHGFLTGKNNRFLVKGMGDIGALLMAELFIFGLLKMYPFTGERITFFLAPFVFYFLIRAYADLRRWPWVHKFFIWHFVVFLAASYLYSGWGYIKLYL